MYKKIIFVLLFLSLKTFVYANAVEDYFKKGNDLYQEQKYSESLDAYNKIYNEGFYSSSLFYNMSNTYYKLGNLAKALQFIEKAYLISPRDSDINFNRKLFLEKTNQNIDFFENVIGFFSINELLVLALIFYSLLFIMFFVSRYNARRLIYWLKFFLVFVLIINIIWIYFSYIKFYKHERAIILNEDVNVYTGPSEDNTVTCVVPLGQKILILDNDNDWFDIGIKEKGVRGFVKRDEVGVI
jgi:tetratricopeptide (TPR) repeat protein